MANTANINSLQLLRNTSKIFSDKTEAISQIKAAGTNDGTIKLARYTESGEVKTIFGIYYKAETAQTGSYTIYDSPKEVIEALEGRVKANEDAIALLNSGDTASGSVAYSIKEAIKALDAGAFGEAGKAIVSISQVDGKVTATTGTIAAEYVTFADADSAITATTVEGALTEINKKVTALTDSSKVTLSSKTGTEDGVLKVYTIYQGGAEVGNINIPKDLVVTSGSVVKGNWVDGKFTEATGGTGTALKLVIANQTAPVYINTLDLVKDHTAGDGISISDTNVVSIKLDSTSEEFLKVSGSGLTLSGVSAAIASAKTEVNVKDEGHVKVASSETNGHLVYTISENDIASATALTAEKDAREAVDGISGNTYVKNTGSKYISGATSLNDADVKLNGTIASVVGGVGLNDSFKIAANTASDASITTETTVSGALYTLDNAIAAAKKANSLSAATGTPLTVTTGNSGTTISVNIESAATVSHIVGYVASENGAGKFVYSDIAGIDAGTY